VGRGERLFAVHEIELQMKEYNLHMKFIFAPPVLCSVDIGQNGKFVDISFATWMAYNVPPMLVNVVISWAYLVVIYYGFPPWVFFWRKHRKEQLDSDDESESHNRVARILREKYNALGRMTFHETAVFFLFIAIVLLWLFREPKFISGWAEHISSTDVGDSTAALFIVLLLFVIPRDLEAFFGCTLIDINAKSN
jgi:di/tricarboxylate transporter